MMQIIANPSLTHREVLLEMGLKPDYTVIKECKRKKPKHLHAWYQGVHNFWKTQGKFTVRQFFYAVISGRVPNCTLNVSTSAKARAGYAKIIDVCTNARLWGIIPFEAIIDDSSLKGTNQYNVSPSEVMSWSVDYYRSNWWNEQDVYLEVWGEKRALSEIILEITDPFGVKLCVGGGYPSWAQMWGFKQRFEDSSCSDGKILYFGDFDPTGLDMDRFIESALSDLDLYFVEVERVTISTKDAITLQKVGVQLKKTDTRTKEFCRMYNGLGITKGIELDALTPTELQQRVKTAIVNNIDVVKLDKKIQEDKNAIDKVKKHLDNYQP